jgi:hypothetical protein
MNITRLNYEEYFLLYVDQELNAAERRAVEEFVQANPDLRDELDLLQQSVLRPDRKINFPDKAALMKSSAPLNPVTENNFEEYFILYGDNELNNEEKDWVEQFVYRHPQHQATFELIQAARLEPDTSISFPNKQSLYRKEKDERVIVMRWWRIAVAAAVLLFLGGASWYFVSNNQKPTEPAVAVKPALKQEGSKSANTAPVPNADRQLANASKDITSKDINDEIVSDAVATNKKIQSVKNTAKEERPSSENTLIAVNKTDIKKSQGSSNTQAESIVTPPEATEKTEVMASTEKPNLIEKPAAASKVIDGPVSPPGLDELDGNDASPIATYASNSDDRIEVLNTSISSKSKMRGFFRKVGRVVGKATNIGPSEEREEKKGVRIASFQIALK